MKTKNQLNDVLTSQGVYPDKIVAKKDGTFAVCKSYFYRSGAADAWGSRVIGALSDQPFKLVGCNDNWRGWPKLSYFEAIIKRV